MQTMRWMSDMARSGVRRRMRGPPRCAVELNDSRLDGAAHDRIGLAGGDAVRQQALAGVVVIAFDRLEKSGVLELPRLHVVKCESMRGQMQRTAEVAVRGAAGRAGKTPESPLSVDHGPLQRRRLHARGKVRHEGTGEVIEARHDLPL